MVFILVTVASKLKSVGLPYKADGFIPGGMIMVASNTQKCWFCLMKRMIFMQGRMIMVASKLTSVGLTCKTDFSQMDIMVVFTCWMGGKDVY